MYDKAASFIGCFLPEGQERMEVAWKQGQTATGSL